MKLLLHTCCAPCSVYCIDTLRKENIEPTVYWFNPNIHPYIEYKTRRDCLKEYTNLINVQAIFEEDYSISRIIQALEIELHVEINPKDTILLFDEVQYAPKVVESLKYFQEDAPQYYVIAAGSLLGVAIHEGVSFPVGKVDELWLHPLSFQEFLMARSEVQLAAFLSNPESPA